MSFGFSGNLKGDIAGEHVDALATFGGEDSVSHVLAAKDAAKLLLSRVWQGKDVSVTTSGHLNLDGTGYLTISITSANPEAPIEAPVAPAPVEPAPEEPVVAPAAIVTPAFSSDEGDVSKAA